VDRAADFKGLTQKQRKEIHERIVPAITEGTPSTSSLHAARRISEGNCEVRSFLKKSAGNQRDLFAMAWIPRPFIAENKRAYRIDLGNCPPRLPTYGEGPAVALNLVFWFSRSVVLTPFSKSEISSVI
jgi:hypothetical protein